MQIEEIHKRCDDYIEAVELFYVGLETQEKLVFSELRQQANNEVAHEVILNRKPTEQESDVIYDYLMEKATGPEDPLIQDIEDSIREAAEYD